MKISVIKKYGSINWLVIRGTIDKMENSIVIELTVDREGEELYKYLLDSVSIGVTGVVVDMYVFSDSIELGTFDYIYAGNRVCFEDEYIMLRFNCKSCNVSRFFDLLSEVKGVKIRAF